jgi:UDP-N-acetylglucosamine 2-epimerase (non-hydrolysing)
MNKLKFITVFGTRPEAIKMAPLVKQLEQYPEEIECKVVVTAQHREMLDQVLDLFSIKPDYDLDIMQERQSLSGITGRVLAGLEPIFAREKPDLVFVHGDTTTTFAAGLAAFYQQIAVGHVEAGLRTYEKYAPFPEEINRCLTGVLTDFHFAPTARAKANLIKENIREERIYVTGNTVIDALFSIVQPDYKFQSPDLKDFSWGKNRLVLVEAHRRENLNQMNQICQGLKKLVEAIPDLELIFPVHLNPAVREPVNRILSGLERVHLIEPLDYLEFANLMNKADLIITDSGGIQEEAPALGKPVLVLRDVTERPEAVEAGTVALVGTEAENIFSLAKGLLNDENEYKKMATARNPFGDGLAAQRIVQAVRSYYGLTKQNFLQYS